jgi:hypothetical protein
MTTVSTAVEIYWGDGGEYGPFPIQTDGEWAGWPDFGKVMHCFLKKSNMSIEKFAEIYGRKTKTNHTPISRRQVERMIYENEVPEAMSRRKIIADLLNIPPMLFGLAVLEEVRLQPHPQIAGANLVTRQTKLAKVIVDTTKYQNTIRTLLTLHHTSQAQDTLEQINTDIRDLESLESQARGDLLYHIRELLFSYQILAAKVQRDQRKFSLSHYHANQAVRVAKAMKDTDLIATSLYARGCTYLQWGRFGTLEKGVLQIQGDKISKAIRDFEAAKKAAENTGKSLHPQLVGFLDVHLSRAYAIRSLSRGEKIPALVITLLDGAEEKIDRENIDDPYTRELIIGSQLGLIRGIYHNNRAVNLSIAGLAGASLKEINTLEGLHQGAVGKHITRMQIWIDIAAADAFMGLEQFEEATERAKRALIAAQDIDSRSYLVSAVDIHGRLLKSPYKNGLDVEELGDMIRETVIKRIRQNEKHLEIERDY